MAASFWQGGTTTENTVSTNSNLTEVTFGRTVTTHQGIRGFLGAKNGIGTVLFGAISGGAGATLTGGCIWQGAVTGGIVAGLNHLMHDGGDPPKKRNKFLDTWVFKNQYFEAEGGLRAGTYIDLGFKNVLKLKLGEYRQSSAKISYYDNKTEIIPFKDYGGDHIFVISAAYIVGAEYKYNIGENRFESFSIGAYGFGLEYSKQSSYQSSFYFGLDTGFGLGAGVGFFGNIKIGWRFNF